MVANLRDQIKAKAQEKPGISRLPIGKYQGCHIVEVSEKTHENRVLYEVVVETADGRTDKMAIWRNSADEITDQKSQDLYISGLGRLCRLYTDLGLEEPDGDDHSAIETAAYDRLGEFLGRACDVVVQAKKGGKPGDTVVYVNAPAGGAGPTVHPQAAPTASAFAGSSPSLDTIPFMRRLD